MLLMYMFVISVLDVIYNFIYKTS